MDIKKLMFLKAMSAKEVKENSPIYFSAVGLATPSGTPTLTNNYGTTINTTSAADNEVTITQVATAEYDAISYRNGFVCVGFDKLIEWIGAGKDLIFDADIDITANPLETSVLPVYVSNRNYNATITGGKIHATFTGVAAYSKNYVEVRCGGCSFTLSNCKLSYE